MKRSVLIPLFGLLAFTIAGNAQNLRAEFAMAEFLSPDDGPYLETYLKLKGNSLEQVEVESGTYSEVLITYHVSKGVWVPFKDAYKVRGPINKEGEAPLDFIDQRRIPLKPGTYELEVTIDDLKDSTDFLGKVHQTIVIEKNKTANLDSMIVEENIPNAPRNSQYYKTRYTISDIQLVDTYEKTTKPNILTKVGYDLVPYTSDFYPESKDELTFYVEIYSTYGRAIAPEQRFLVDLYVENADDGKVVEGLRKFVKRNDAKVSPILQSFPIGRLPTGNYNLVVEVKDEQNRLMERSFTFFQRMNTIQQNEYALETGGEENELYGSWVSKYQDLDMLKEYLRCLHPISSQEEIMQVNTRMNFRDRNMMWKFMYYFWKTRNPEDPEGAWLKYWAQVEKVNAAYSTNLKKGYDTDRGRVYLQYGPPNTISPNYFEPNTYPYEIWHYYVLKNPTMADQTNRKFVFANVNRGSSEFELIHSDAKNEITNRRWQYDLTKRSSQTIDLDVEEGSDQYGGRSKDFFQNPY